MTGSRTQGMFRRSVEAVDARSDGGLQGGGHVHLGDATAQLICTRSSQKQAALEDVAQHLLDEERITGSACADQRSQFRDRRVRPKELGGELGNLRIVQRA